MNETLSSLSRFMMVVTPDTNKFKEYQHLLPGTAVIDTHDQAPAQVAETILAQVEQKPFRILVLTNRPPFSPAEVVELVRASPRGRDLYIIVLTPHDVRVAFDVRSDIDDLVFLSGNEDLTTVIPAAVTRYLRTMELHKNFITATRTARTAMDSAAEYGSLIHFFDATEACTKLETLSDIIYDFLSNKGLEVVLGISADGDHFYRPANKASGSLHSLLAQLKKAGKRMVSADRLLGYHFGYFTLLVANCPTENPEKHGQLKDSLAHFCAIAEARIKTILIQQRTSIQHEQVLAIMHLIRQSTDESNVRTKAIMKKLLAQIEQAANTFDMHFKEEQKLLEIVQQATESLEQLRENDELIEAHFLELIEVITSVIELSRADKSAEKPSETIELF